LLLNKLQGSLVFVPQGNDYTNIRNAMMTYFTNFANKQFPDSLTLYATLGRDPYTGAIFFATEGT
jgi:hypothetical protein